MENDEYILIVEDSRTQARQIEMIVRPLGYQVRTALSGEEALSILGQGRPVLVISDILMPEMDGYQLCRRIKEDKRFREVPVILLTQLSDPNEVIRGLESGADDFIVKPYSEERLITRINALLNMKLRQGPARERLRVLIVEDSPTQAEQLRYMLEGHGYSVDMAANGDEGLAAAKKIMPAIILSDILMPVMDGYEMAYKIREDPALKEIPIIFITALSDRKDVIRRASVVADGLFTKPYDDHYLLSKIESLIAMLRHGHERPEKKGLEVTFNNEQYVITSDRRQILTFLLSTYENAVQQNRDLVLMQRELQRANEQLEERVRERTRQCEASEENFRALAENAYDGIMISTDGKSHVYVNQRMAEITGYSVRELLSLGINDLVHPDERPMVMERFQKRRRGEPVPSHYETVFLAKDRRDVPVEITVSKTSWEGGTAFMAIVRDITDRRKREEALVRMDKLESLGVLAGGIAHDFNNLLTGILGNVSLAKTSADPGDKVYKILSDIENASQRARDLTQQLLTFAKGGAPVREISDIRDFLRESVGLAMSGSEVRCELSIPDDLCHVEIDKGQISQVIHNLLINAQQAIVKEGIIAVSAENVTVGEGEVLVSKAGEYVKISVRDNGKGIPEKYLNKIFDPYFTTKEGGSGLGLATTYSIVKNHGGYITVESQVGAGTAFHIWLPASLKGTVVPVKEGEERTVPGRGERILVMDDEDIVRDVTGQMLTTLGYEAHFARDGAEAVRLFREAKEAGRPFEAVIMDLTIPGGMSGSEAIQRLREMDPGVKAIVSSGYSNAPVMANYREYGFSAVIAKPYRLTDLGTTVRKVLRKG